MKILHLADIHLDRVFRDADDRRGAARRRAELRDALSRALAAGKAEGVGAVCLAGDVYEHASVTADTVAFLSGELARAEVPVLVAPGNHDPVNSGSPWRLADWPGNVHVFTSDRPEAFELGEGVVVWGSAFTATTAPPGVPGGFRAPADGRVHLLLIHAALTGERWADEGRHRSVTRAQLQATGANHVMLGHFHDGYGDDLLCYPGSPEPLGWGERHGTHGASLVTVEERVVRIRAVPTATRRYVERVVRADGATSSSEIESRIAAAAAGPPGASLRVLIEGEVAPGCVVDPESLAERCVAEFAELVVVDRTRAAYDLAEIAQERSVRGRFAARLLARGDAAGREAALAGLRALDGHTEVLGAG
ncbi:MAG TPA: metallophosphoesterase [Gaiellales bacterium]|jgi:DNA repair exonuclease SbcCD nuclease subunit|nr:metallophosphoesterase [Gaiellales bacterium]